MDGAWRREDDSSSDSAPLHIPLRRSSTTQSSSTGQRYQDGSNRNSERRHWHAYEEHSKELKQQLLTTKKQLKVQELRTAEAERELLQLANHLKRVNDARLVALQEASKATEELKLYKIQLQHAQQEIFRAQDVLNDVDRQRHEAEREAARARTTARKLNQTMMVQAAIEEGRRIGLREGLERGRNLGLQEAQLTAEIDEGEYDDENDYFDDVEHRPRSLFIGSSEDIQPSRSPPTEPPAPLADPIPIPPPEAVQPTPDNRPRSFRNPSPSVHHTHVSIPPDGYIPALDADHFIRIPPPHELSRPPPTPERVSSPPLPHVSQQEEPLPIPRRYTGHQRNTSLGSTSTSYSQLEMVNGPSGRQSPLSVIAEVRSVRSSPNPQSTEGHDLRHQSSWGGGSQHSTMDPGHSRAPSIGREQDAHQPTQSVHRRPSTGSNISRSLRPPSAAQESRRKSSSSASSVPGINVLPPSRSPSLGTPRSQNANLESMGVTGSPKPPSILLQSSSSPNFGSQQLPPGFIPSQGGYSPNTIQSSLPGAYQEEMYQAPRSFAMERPNATSNRNDSDDDTVSSAMSNDTLSTPVLGRRTRHKHALHADPLMTPPQPQSRRESGWDAAVRLAGSPVPIPFDNQLPRGNKPSSRS